MSGPFVSRKAERRAEKEAALQARWEREQIERQRRAERSIHEKIREANSFEDVKEILHELAEKAGLE